MRFSVVAALLLSTAAWADEAGRPAIPSWATDDAACEWQWREGGGFGLWTEACTLGPGHWDIAWDDTSRAFWQRLDAAPAGRVIQGWILDSSGGIDPLAGVLRDSGDLPSEAGCVFRLDDAGPMPVGPDTQWFTLAPEAVWPAEDAAQDQVPDDPCGAYGISASGIRHFLTDPRWPDRVVFVDFGQERPKFDPASLIVLP